MIRSDEDNVLGGIRGVGRPVEIPTVEDIDDFNQQSYSSVIHQIATGQGIYWGYEFDYIHDTKRHKAMSPHSLSETLSNGGKVLVVGSTMNRAWESYRQDPRIVFWAGDKSEIRRHMPNGNNFPTNTHLVILSRFTSHTESDRIRDEARRKQCPVVGPVNDGQVTEMLEEITKGSRPAPIETPTPPPAPKKELRKARRGDLVKLVKQHYDPNRPNIDEARRLFTICEQDGIKTTLLSVEQSIRKFKKDAGIISPRAVVTHGKRINITPNSTPMPAPVPVPVPTPTKSAGEDKYQQLLQMIDDATSALSLIREEVVGLRQRDGKMDQLRALMKELS